MHGKLVFVQHGDEVLYILHITVNENVLKCGLLLDI